MLVFTSCLNNYLPKARVLASSLKKFHPDWHFRLLLGEAPPEDFELAREPFDSVMQFSALEIPNYPAWSFKHRLVEICTAVKGQALNQFLEKEGWDKVIYLDPDILVLNPLTQLANMLDAHDILLTPHQLAPQTGVQAIIDNEICSLTHGVFNLGFAACANRSQGVAFSRFWRDRLADWCRDDMANGLFTDQKWCDLAPAYFSRLGIVRDPGCNAASWNLTDREITEDGDGQFLANGQPLRFYHFTGYDSGAGQTMSAIYGAAMPAVAKLWQMYGQMLERAGQQRLGSSAWAGASYSNGRKVSDQARLYYRENPAIQALYPEPLLTDAAGKAGFAGHWAELRAKEDNKLYVLARKPFRLARLTALYLARHGGIKAAPRLLARAGGIWRQEGMAGLMAKIRKFKRGAGIGMPMVTLAQALKPPSQWAERIRQAFSGQNGALIIDHMYGGGANDYREARIRAFLEAGRPVLLATWDFFGRQLRCQFRLAAGASLDAHARDITELAEACQSGAIQFGHILLNELVLWSSAKFPKNHYAALPHLLGQIERIRRHNGARLEIALHDFYCLCPSYNLLENGANFCGASKDAARCAQCLPRLPFNVPKDFDLAKWRAAWKEALASADELRAFSDAAVDLTAGCLELPRSKFTTAPHEPLGPLQPVPLPGPGAPMRIGVIGRIALHKGAAIVKELGRLLAPDESIVVIGELEGQAPANVKATGAYQRWQLPEIAAAEGITCALIPSIWPETFCYTAQEAMQMELPLVVFPLGAQAERCRGYAKGRVAKEISAQAALEALRALDAARKSQKR